MPSTRHQHYSHYAIFHSFPWKGSRIKTNDSTVLVQDKDKGQQAGGGGLSSDTIALVLTGMLGMVTLVAQTRGAKKHGWCCHSAPPCSLSCAGILYIYVQTSKRRRKDGTRRVILHRHLLYFIPPRTRIRCMKKRGVRYDDS